jgi:hypothetical protein
MSENSASTTRTRSIFTVTDHVEFQDELDEAYEIGHKIALEGLGIYYNPFHIEDLRTACHQGFVDTKAGDYRKKISERFNWLKEGF